MRFARYAAKMILVTARPYAADLDNLSILLCLLLLSPFAYAPNPSALRHRWRDISLDIRPHFSYKPRISLAERTPAGDTG